MDALAERSRHRSFRDERAELRVLLASKGLARAPLLSRMLSFVCEQYFLGQTDALKEYSIGTGALGRGPEFDPDNDSIVRVTASRLRKRLLEYYAGEGANHRVKIFLPETGYMPIFVTESAAEPPPAQPGVPAPAVSRQRGKRAAWVAIAGIIVAALIAVAYFVRRSGEQTHMAATPATPYLHPATLGPATRIAAGLEGHGRIDSAGTAWVSDRYFQGGVIRRFTERPIRRTLDPLLYLTAREGDFRYDIPLKPGVYELHLHFAETVYGIKRVGDFGDGLRLFDVFLNEKPLLAEFDIISDAAGSNIADERVFKDVSPGTDGMLHLRFSPNDGMALLNAIEILPGTSGKMLPVRIAASETPVHDNSGRQWRRDQYFSGGNAAKWIRKIKGPEDQALYYSHRWGHFDYAIPAAEGRYQLALRFVESHFGSEGQMGGIHPGGVGSRLFDVFCNGEALIRRLDVFKEAGGPHIELVKTFNNLTPNAQGKLNLSFVPVKNKAIVSAIEVVPDP